MKTFRELQPGDKIYYWDHGKLHEQIVHEATIETKTYTDYWDKEKTREVLHLVAGKNRRTNVKLYGLNYSKLFFGSMRRFACLEAALYWINERKSYYEYRLNRLEKRVNSRRNCLNKYNEAVNQYYWINERKSYYEYRLNRLEKRVNSCRNCINKYNETLKQYGK